jgi:hypothetical protein
VTHCGVRSRSEDEACQQSPSTDFALRSRWSTIWTCLGSSPRDDWGSSGTQAVRCMSHRRSTVIVARSLSNWRSTAGLATVAVATVTNSNPGQPPRGCLCIRLRWVPATALAVTFPGSSAGEGLQGHRMATARLVSSAKRKTGDDATGTSRTRRVDEFPSITSIEGPSIIVITLRSLGGQGLTKSSQDSRRDRQEGKSVARGPAQPPRRRLLQMPPELVIQACWQGTSTPAAPGVVTRCGPNR